MAIVKDSDFEVVSKPELIVGITAPVGTPIQHVQRVLTDDLTARGYRVHDIRLSSLIEAVEPAETLRPTPADEYERIKNLMDRGNALRDRMKGGEVLGLLAAAEISQYRPVDDELPALDGHAFLIRQFKHPDEVDLLRQIYGDAFHVVGVYSPESTRKQTLMVTHGMTEDQAVDLIDRDEGEDEELGQQLRDTFHLADVFVRLTDTTEADNAETEIRRYLALAFADLRNGIPTPRVDEYGMFAAHGASLRSADLSRQVGAAILTKTREIVGMGCNEVPAAEGGQYWPDRKPDARDFALGFDSNARKKTEILEEVLDIVDPGFSNLPPDRRTDRLQEVGRKLGPTRVMNLTEFGRAVHAEMEALLAAGRIGVSVRGCTLYTTTFPCHNCAKHIVDAGIARVIYVEPYPKSLTKELHKDAVRLEEQEATPDERVSLESFVGVAPRRFESLFSMRSSTGRKYRRKGADGEFDGTNFGLRTPAPALNYMQREAAAAAALREFMSGGQGELDLD